MTENLNFNDALSILDTLSKEVFLTDAWVPSLNKTIKLKELNTKQQRNIIESVFDVIEEKSPFSKTLFDIISENCLEEPNVVKHLTVIDKVCLAFYIRKQLSDTIKIVFQETPKIEADINIDDILEKFKSFEHPEEETITHVLDSVKIEVDIKPATIQEDSNFDISIFKSNKETDELEKYKNIVGSAFLNEVAKNIKEIKINDNLFNYNDLSIDNKIKVVEKLPASLIKNILDKTMDWKSKIEKICTVNFENIEKIIKIDAFLFLIN